MQVDGVAGRRARRSRPGSGMRPRRRSRRGPSCRRRSGTTSSTTARGSRLRVHDDGDGLVAAGRVEDRRDARVDLGAVGCRPRPVPSPARPGDRAARWRGSRYLARIFIASTPVLLGPADLLKAGGRTLRRCLEEGLARGGRPAEGEIRDGECRVRQPSYLDHPRPLALRPCLTTGLPLSFRMGIGGTRAKVKHSLDELAEEVSPSWQQAPASGEATARAGVERSGAGGQPASLAAGGGQRTRSVFTLCNDAAPLNLSREDRRRRISFRATPVRS